MSSRYRKRPVEVEAVQLAGGNSVQVATFITEGGGTFRADTHPTDAKQDVFYITTLEGDMRATNGDWIIRGVQGEFYPCRDDIFRATYEEV